MYSPRCCPVPFPEHVTLRAIQCDDGTFARLVILRDGEWGGTETDNAIDVAEAFAYQQTRIDQLENKILALETVMHDLRTKIK